MPPTNMNIVPNSASQKKKICKSQKPVLEVVSVLNIIDCATKIKNDICQKLSKNVTDFSSISSKNLSYCGAPKKENLIELSRGPDPVPNEIYENLRSEIEHSFQKHVQDLGNSNEFIFNTIHDQIKNLETLTSEILQVTSSSGSAISSLYRSDPRIYSW